MPIEQIEQVLLDTESTLLDRYHGMQQAVMVKLEQLKQRFEDRDCWWWRNRDANEAIENLQRFIHNMAFNFGEASPGYNMVQSEAYRQQRRAQILKALDSYSDDRDIWRQILRSPA
jgi:hypothetical protein